jgi:Skp family chaperone for outer membrane proteins
MADAEVIGEMTINQAIAEVAKTTERAIAMDTKIEKLANAFHQWRLTMEASAKKLEDEKAQRAQAKADAQAKKDKERRLAVLDETNARR